jgi:hypothetical protein
MKQLKYGFYGEDDAHKIFLHNYLKHFADTIIFERDDDFCNRFRANGRKQVDTKFAYVAREGLAKHQHKVFFVGRDVDSYLDAQFNQRLDHFRKERIENLLVMLPIQCVEHWLWYLKRKKDNPALTKNISLESQLRDKAKFEVYGEEEPPNRVSNPIVDELSKRFDIPWLESRSDSFKHFHNQVIEFLNQYDKTQTI